MKYSIDTSAIIDSWIRRYPPGNFPQVWKKIEELIDQRILIAVEDVLIELEKKHDEIYQWAREREYMFVPFNNKIELAVKEIMKDENHKKIIDQRTNRSGADPWVIALAKVMGCTVVTSENPTNTPNRPHIPDVCNALGIKWINMLQLIQEQKWVF